MERAPDRRPLRARGASGPTRPGPIGGRRAARRRARRRRLAAALLALLAACGGDEGATTAPDAAPPRPDVFVLLVDTLRADALGLYNPALPIGDALAALARDGVVLDALRAPSSWTRSSVATLFTGQPVARHGVFGRLDVLDDRHPTLAGLLREHGYATRGWSTNPNVLALWGLDRGFDAFHDLTPRQTRRGALQAADVVDEVIASLREDPARPVFAYVHVTDPHNPYLPSEADLAAVRALGPALEASFRGDLAREKARELLADDYPRYLGEVVDTDRALGRLLEHLRETGRYDDALIVVVSDHGEEFGDHGGVGHGRTLYDEVLRVPGIVKWPGNRHAGTRIEAPAELADLQPTILAAVGLAPPPGVTARDVEPILAGSPADPQRPGFYALTLDSFRLSGVRVGPHKLVYDHRRDEARLYDVEADPDERRDLAAERPVLVARLLRLLEASQSVHAPGWHLRACGCASGGALDLEIRGLDAAPATIGFETGDRIAPGEGRSSTRIALDLRPTTAAAADPSDPRATRADVDDLVFAEGPDLRIVDPGGRPIELALGNGYVARRGPALALADLAGRATVDPNEPVLCDPSGKRFWRGDAPGACVPHWRLWRVPPAASLREDEVDEATRERLRALGYEW